MSVLVPLGARDRQRVDGGLEDGSALGVEHASQSDHPGGVRLAEPQTTRVAPAAVESLLVAGRLDLLAVVADQSGQLLRSQLPRLVGEVVKGCREVVGVGYRRGAPVEVDDLGSVADGDLLGRDEQAQARPPRSASAVPTVTKAFA